MSAHSIRLKNAIFTLLFFVCCSTLQATTLQVPEWFKLTASLEHAPELNQPVALHATLHAIIGNIADAQIRLILPEGWKSDSEMIEVASIRMGKQHLAVFKVTPGNYLSQGSVVVEAAFQVPKNDLITYIKREMPQDAAELGETIGRWPDLTRRYADISFALTPEETFYPLSGNMWLSYDDRIIAQEGFAGQYITKIL